MEGKSDTQLSGSSGSNCKQCGKISKDKAGSVSEPFCECAENQTSDPSIRLGPVPDSAFRPPTPLPERSGGKDGHQQPGSISVGRSGGTKYEIVSIREKHGEFRKAIPCMPFVVAAFCCLLNVVLPGTGTLVAAMTVLCGCRTEHESRRRALGYNLMAAFLQLVTAPIIVGWIWSVYWGITFVNVSATKALQDPNSAATV